MGPFVDCVLKADAVFKCGFDGCLFEGNYRMVLDHQTSVHMSLGGGQRGRQATAADEEDLAKWKEERKKKFPKSTSSQATASPSTTPAAAAAAAAAVGVVRPSLEHQNRNQRRGLKGREKRSQHSKERRDSRWRRPTLFQKVCLSRRSCSTCLPSLALELMIPFFPSDCDDHFLFLI